MVLWNLPSARQSPEDALIDPCKGEHEWGTRFAVHKVQLSLNVEHLPQAESVDLEVKAKRLYFYYLLVFLVVLGSLEDESRSSKSTFRGQGQSSRNASGDSQKWASSGRNLYNS